MSAANPRYRCDDCDYAGDDGRDAMWHAENMRHSVSPTPEAPAEAVADGPWAVCPYPHCPLPDGHSGAHFLPGGSPRLPADHPVDGPRDEHGNITAPESPDWHARYEGYAFRQIRRVRETMAAELERDRERGKKTPAELERQAARLASYDDLITTLDHLKGQLK